MTRVNKIVTSEIEGSNLSQSDPVGEETYAYDSNGRISYYGSKGGIPVIEPGVVYGANKDSGDGYHLNTIKLYPHAPNGGIPNDDRYLIIDPTFPNHIHIRPGGTIDQSNAELILGGESNFVKVDDGSRVVTISSKEPQSIQAVLNINYESNEYMIFNDVVPVSNNGWYTEVSGVRYYVADVTYLTEGQTQIYVPGATFQHHGVYNMFSPEISSQWQFDGEGIVYGPGVGAETTFTRIATINSDGSGQNVKIGDDAWIGDVNNANRVAIVGIQDSLEGGILLGERLGEKIYTNGEDLTIEAAQNMTLNAVSGDMNFYMDGGMFIGNSDSNNQIIKRSDLNALPQDYFQAVRWTPNFTATGLTFTGTDNTHPAYQSYYVKQGQLVSFWIAIDCATVTSFGTGQLKVDLPFAPLPGTMNHFSGWVDVDETQNPDLAGHMIVNADHLPNVQTLDLHYVKSAGGANSAVMEAQLKQGTPATLTTLTNIYINGTYICE